MRDKIKKGKKIEEIEKIGEKKKKEKVYNNFDFGVKNRKEKENVNPTEREKCTKLKKETTETIEKLPTSQKAPQKSTNLSTNFESRFSFNLKNIVDQPTIGPMSTNDQKVTVEGEKLTLLNKTVLTNRVGKSCVKKKENVFDFGASLKKARIANTNEFENVQVVGSDVNDYVHRVQSCGMVFGGSKHDARPDDCEIMEINKSLKPNISKPTSDIVQVGHEHGVHLQDMVLDGQDDVFVRNVGNVGDKGADGVGGHHDDKGTDGVVGMVMEVVWEQLGMTM